MSSHEETWAHGLEEWQEPEENQNLGSGQLSKVVAENSDEEETVSLYFSCSSSSSSSTYFSADSVQDWEEEETEDMALFDIQRQETTHKPIWVKEDEKWIAGYLLLKGRCYAYVSTNDNPPNEFWVPLRLVRNRASTNDQVQTINSLSDQIQNTQNTSNNNIAEVSEAGNKDLAVTHHTLSETDSSDKPLLSEMQKERQEPVLTGLQNIGNSCYMNSILQCLYNIFDLTQYFHQDHYKKDINRKNPMGHEGKLAEEFGRLIKTMGNEFYSYINPESFKVTIGLLNDQFAGHNQQDPHELLMFLIEGLHQDLLTVNLMTDKTIHLMENENYEQHSPEHQKTHKSIIYDLFQGQFKSILQCLTCHQKSEVYETFVHLSLAVTSTDKCTLQECLSEFFKEEELRDDNKVQCNSCNTRRDFSKKTYLWKLPPVLIIHLKRFAFDGKQIKKLHTYVDFPLEDLNLVEFTSENKSKIKKYNLSSVSNHYGKVHYGHCTSYCKIASRQHWINFDDKNIKKVPNTLVKSTAAYILFYTS